MSTMFFFSSPSDSSKFGIPNIYLSGSVFDIYLICNSPLTLGVSPTVRNNKLISTSIE